jgi:hypothetical protein
MAGGKILRAKKGDFSKSSPLVQERETISLKPHDQSFKHIYVHPHIPHTSIISVTIKVKASHRAGGNSARTWAKKGSLSGEIQEFL